MRRHDAAAWVVIVCATTLRLSQAKTLAALVAAALDCQRISLAAIGRSMLGTAKHQIKRCWRFCANPRVEPTEAMRGVVRRLVNKKRAEPLLVALDWVDVRGYQTLVASAVRRVAQEREAGDGVLQRDPHRFIHGMVGRFEPEHEHRLALGRGVGQSSLAGV